MVEWLWVKGANGVIWQEVFIKQDMPLCLKSECSRIEKCKTLIRRTSLKTAPQVEQVSFGYKRTEKWFFFPFKLHQFFLKRNNWKNNLVFMQNRKTVWALKSTAEPCWIKTLSKCHSTLSLKEKMALSPKRDCEMTLIVLSTLHLILPHSRISTYILYKQS